MSAWPSSCAWTRYSSVTAISLCRFFLFGSLSVGSGRSRYFSVLCVCVLSYCLPANSSAARVWRRCGHCRLQDRRQLADTVDFHRLARRRASGAFGSGGRASAGSKTSRALDPRRAEREMVLPGRHKLKSFVVARFRGCAAQTRRAAVAAGHKPAAAWPLQGDFLLSAGNECERFLVAGKEGFGAERAVVGGAEESSPGRPQHNLFRRRAGGYGQQRGKRQDRAERKKGFAAHGRIVPDDRGAVQAQFASLFSRPPPGQTAATPRKAGDPGWMPGGRLGRMVSVASLNWQPRPVVQQCPRTDARWVILDVDLSLERHAQRPRGRVDRGRDRRAPGDGLFAHRRDRSQVWTLFRRGGHGDCVGVRLVVPPDQWPNQRDFARRLQRLGRRGAGDGIGTRPGDLSAGRNGRTDPDSYRRVETGRPDPLHLRVGDPWVYDRGRLLDRFDPGGQPAGPARPGRRFAAHPRSSLAHRDQRRIDQPALRGRQRDHGCPGARPAESVSQASPAAVGHAHGPDRRGGVGVNAWLVARRRSRQVGGGGRRQHSARLAGASRSGVQIVLGAAEWPPVPWRSPASVCSRRWPSPRRLPIGRDSRWITTGNVLPKGSPTSAAASSNACPAPGRSRARRSTFRRGRSAVGRVCSPRRRWPRSFSSSARWRDSFPSRPWRESSW